MNIVLDTNCLLMSLSRRSLYYPVWRNFVDGKYTLCLTNEILAEYEEIHYDVLKQTPFPRIEVIDIDEFLCLLR